VVKILLDSGAEVNTNTGFYGTALRAASEQGHERVVKLLLEAGSDVNCGGALWAAARRGKTQVVKLLLEFGADVNASYDRFGTALQVASKGKHEGVVRMLLSHGAQPYCDSNVEEGEERTPE
jgi:ankyrin repeat protein